MEVSACTLVFFAGAAFGFIIALVTIVLGLWYLGVMSKRKQHKNDEINKD